MKKLYFVRHGLTEHNVAGLYSGQTETDLTTEGRQQAKAAGKNAKNLHIDCIVSSPSRRAQETAQIIAKEIGYPIKKIHINKLFVERDFGELEGKPWRPDLDLDGISDIETVDSIIERAKLALDFLTTLDAHHILVVSHGSFGRALRSHILPNQPYVNRTSSNKNVKGIPNAEIVQWL